MRVVKIQEEPNNSLTSIISTTSETNHPIETIGGHQKIALPTMEGIELEYIEKIVSLEAQGNYTLIHFNDKKSMLVCKTLRELENRVNQVGTFVRVHRSHSINLNRLDRYVRGSGGYVVLENGANISVSNSRKQEFLRTIKEYYC